MNYPVLAAAFIAVSASAFGQQLVITAEGHHGAAVSEVMKDDVSIVVNRRSARIEKWIPLRGDQASLDLYIVIDDGEDSGYAHGLAAGHSHSAVIVPDPGRLISGAYGIAMWPTAVILDADGIVQHIGLGLHEKERVR